MPSDTKRKNEAGAKAAGDAAAPPAPPPPASAAFAGKATDLEALRDSVVEAAGVGAGLWLSYLFVYFYLAIAAGSVTHRDLFFGNPVRLPFLNVDLPLVGFFVLGPLLFLIAHNYVLLHFVLLAGKVGAFHAELSRQIVDEETRARLRRQLPSNIFAQFLAGPRELRIGLLGLLLRLIAWITLVFAPLALLAFFQFQFLPYHSEAITWWHRSAVAIDLASLWMLWPRVVRGQTAWPLGRRELRRIWGAGAVLGSIALGLLVFTIGTFPDEWLHDAPPSTPFVPTWSSDDGWQLKSLHEFLFVGDVDPLTRKPDSLWSNRLVVPLVDASDLPKFDLRGRRLEQAVLDLAHLRKVDLVGAQLQGASLSSAELQEAALGGAQLQGAQLFSAKLQGASLVAAQLQDARLLSANLQGASLELAHLQGALLVGAQLQGALLDDANLQGASLADADLRGASLKGAQLQNTVLVGADLRGASLEGAQLQGALLEGAKLQGASLKGASVQGVYGMPKADLSDQPQTEEREKWLAGFLGDLACSSDPPPYVARGLLTNGGLQSTGSQVTVFADKLRKAKSDQSACPGVKGFTDNDWAALDRLVAIKGKPAADEKTR